MKLTAIQFIDRLYEFQSDEEKRKIVRYFKADENDQFMGIRMGQVFAVAKEFIQLEPDQLEILLESPVHEIRAGAVSVMNQQGRDKKTTEERRKELYELYLRRHDRINNWDLVDLGAAHVVGRYLFDKPRDILYELAHSENVWERRTAIVSTSYFLSKSDRLDTFQLAEILVNDPEDLIHKAVGGWIRQAGKGDVKSLLLFLDNYAATMPRTMLRYAVEHLAEDLKNDYMNRGKITDRH